MRKFTVETMKALRYVSWPAVSKDETLFACVRSWGEEKTGEFPSEIVLIDRASGKERVLTEVGHSEKQPVFLPDGSLFYLSDESGEWQIWKRESDGSAKQQLTSLRHGVVRYDVSEERNAIAFEATMWPEELQNGTAFTEMSTEEREAWTAEMDLKPWVATDLVYKMDEWFGMRKGEYSHIGVLELATGEYRMLEDKGVEYLFPAWSHDGKMLAFQGYPYGGAKGRQAESFVWDLGTGALSQMTKDIGVYADHSPVFTADDKAVIVTGFPPFEDGSTVSLPYLVEIDSKAYRLILPENATEPCDGVHPLVAFRSERGENRGFMMLDHSGESIYFLAFDHGKGIICKTSVANDAPAECVLRAEGDIAAFTLTKDDEPVYLMDTSTMPNELFFDGKQLTHSNEWLAGYTLGRTEKHCVRTKDGEATLEYWITLPPDFEAGKKYPAILELKGGPETCCAETSWHEIQAEAGAGFIVIYGNPRGSTGYGRAFNADAVAWGMKAVEDHLSILDDVIAEGYIDENRVGITGGSYGGYMTMKLIGRTKKFAAAVAQRALANPVTSYGTGDMGFISSGEVPENFSMKEYLNDRARGNVISYIDNMKTPLLILHASNDYRCGFEQAEQIFVAMRDRNPEVPVRLVRFPGENHALTRTGKLHHQLRHLQELVRWFEKYLQEGKNND